MDKTYVPKLSQNETLFISGKKLPAIIMDAYLVAGYKNSANTIRESCGMFIVDPNTNYFTGDYCKEKKSFNKLTTTPKKPYIIDDLLTNEGTRKYKFVSESIDYQIKEGAGLIILPYLYTDSIEDVKFNLNLTMISDGLRLIEDKKIEIPAYAMINLGNSILSDYQKLDFLIERYQRDFGDKIKGFFLMINQFDCRKASEEELLGLAHLTYNLSSSKEVFLLKIGDYGELLCCLGATGYSSSLGGGETFNASGLVKQIIAFGRKHKEVTYMAEVFNYLNDEALKKINYKCFCAICRNGLPDGYNDTKAHFLERKLESMEKLNKIPKESRIDFMKEKIDSAILLANQYNAKYALSIKTDFLVKWRKVLDKHWIKDDAVKEEADLDSLIEQARSQVVTK